MNNKKLIILIVGILIIAAVSFIYINSTNEKINDNNKYSAIANRTTVNDTNESNLTTTNSIKKSVAINSKNQYNNNNSQNNAEIPKNSQLTFNKAFNLAKKQAKGAFASSNVKVYVKYVGSGYTLGDLYWDFDVYREKDSKYLGTFSIKDSTGKATII